MVNIIKQEVVIEESLKKKLELICAFSNTTLKIINGSIRKIDRTNFLLLIILMRYTLRTYLIRLNYLN